MEEKNLKQEIKELKEILTENKKPKDKKIREFKLPSVAKISKAKAKQNFCTVLYIKENRDASFMKTKIEEQTITIEKLPRIATPDNILNYKGKPLIIIPEWSVKPFSPTENYNETEKEKMNAKGWRLLLAKMKLEAIQAKKNISWWWIIIGVLIIGGIIVYALMTGKAH